MGAEFLSLTDLFDRIQSGERPNRPGIVITVDDGYRDFAELAVPIFTELECPVTMFLTTEVISGRIWYWWDKVEYAFLASPLRLISVEVGERLVQLDLRSAASRRRATKDFTEILKSLPDSTRQLTVDRLGDLTAVDIPRTPPAGYASMTWDDVRRVESDLVRFGPHSRTHPILRQTDDAAAREEILGSWEAIRVECRNPVPVFCYPNGTASSFSERDCLLVRATGLRGAMMYGRRRIVIGGSEPVDSYRIPRVEMPKDPHAGALLVSALRPLEISQDGALGEMSFGAPHSPEGADPPLGTQGRRRLPPRVRRVEAIVSCVAFQRHHLGVLRGLFELAKAGTLRIRFDNKRLGVLRDFQQGLTVTYAHDDLAPLVVAYDMMDWPEIASHTALRQCDVYFKRSVPAAGWPELSLIDLRKVIPWGLSLPATIEPFWRSLPWYWSRYRNATDRQEREKRLFALAKNAAFKALRRGHSGYAIEPERLPEADYVRLAKNPRVFLQTRLWDPVTTSSRYHRTIAELNRFRIDLVRALRDALGTRFVGGVIPNDYSQRHCPELLTGLGADFASYLCAMRDSLIAVTEAGIHGSNGARLPELLGAGRCVLSERLVYAPLVPPTEGKNLVYFDSIEDCVLRCRQLLDHPEEAVTLGRGARAYYEAEVSPSAMATRALLAAGVIGPLEAA